MSEFSHKLTIDELRERGHYVPKLGERTWMNHPDGSCLGVVVGFVDKPDQPRHGQPIIEAEADEELFGKVIRHKGDQLVCHPYFLLPFPYGSPEHREAMARQGDPL